MSHSKRSFPHNVSGFSLLEMMVVLAIVATITGVTAAGLRGPSPMVQLERTIIAFQREAAEARHRAVLEQIVIPLSGTDCDGNEVIIKFFPNGTANGPNICLTQAGFTGILRLSNLTGYLALDASK
jgi:prepilin-type N-terminal cleavage/methylation domain-containing protein